MIPPPPPDWTTHRHTIEGVDFELRESGPWNERRPWPMTPALFGVALRRARKSFVELKQEKLAQQPPVNGLLTRETISRWENGTGNRVPTDEKVLALAQRFHLEATGHPDPAVVRGALVEYLQSWVLLRNRDEFAEWDTYTVENALRAGPWDLRRYTGAVWRLLFVQSWISWDRDLFIVTPTAGQHLTAGERRPAVRRLSRTAATRSTDVVERRIAALNDVPPDDALVPTVILIPTTQE